ncbi:fibronectin type III domain-containing protein [Geomonas azotofigens]|uniref:fibronectin type III domain-containing protein n=1 Tax=Geomonas azotofigens TaxID=2843196 RepID=UPI001C0FA4C6|nr:fibronectin type III domain-containing protein [Geomonas azotofigens]MBU5614086.1 fibronectin type III domain-containing protein [Geomonas azotofigens]
MKIIQEWGHYVSQSVGYYLTWNGQFEPVTSDALGNYSITVVSTSADSMTIVPPIGSGFAQTVVNGLNVTKDILQSIILSMPDTSAPIILSGPTVSSYGDTTATIEWQTNEPAKGALVYGTSNPPTGTSVPESAFTATHSQSLTGLSANTTYYVKITATDAANNGPTTSSIITFTTKPTADKTPPEILTGPTMSSITDTSAVVEWTTNEPSTGSVVYGFSSAPNLTVPDATLATSHRVTLTGLTAETVYYVKVAATDASNNGPTSSSVISFSTVAAPDTKAPVIIEGPMAINVSDSGATIVWKTDEPATTGVSWNDGTVYGVLSDNSLTTNHSVTITGLAATKTYSYTVSSKDAFNNGPTLSTAKTFTTSATPDMKPPVFIQTPIVKNTTHESAVLYWETDEPSSSTIQYGTTESFGTADAKAQLLTKHNRPLTGLLPGTTYYFRVQATDASGNTATSQTYTFTTDINPDTKAPVITQAASIIYSTDTAATVAFKTDKPCDTVVNYGPNGTTGNQKSNSEKVNDHQVTLSNLTPNTSYSVQVSCTDMSGNTVVASAGTPSTMMALNYAAFILSDAVIGAAGTGFTTPSLPDTTPPVITAVPAATAITSSMVRIVWSTNEIADSQVYFGVSGQNLTNFAGDIVQVTGHSVALTNLAPNTTYQFKVQTTDPSNNTTVSSVYSFTTAALADTTPPVISAISASGVNSSQIHVAWTTNEPSTTVLKYGTTPFTLTAQVSIAGTSTDHSVTLYNLIPGTTYYVAPVSADGSGNATQGATQSVTLAGQQPVSYTVTAAAGAGGSVTPVSQAVYSGYQLALAVAPSQGYMVNSITGCGGTLVGSVYTTAGITSNCTVSASFKIDPNFTGTILATTAYPPAGTYAGGTLMVKLKVSTPSAAIYYTTDGSTPSTSSAVYSAAIPVVGNKTIKFFAKDGTTLETAKSAAYTVTATGQPGASFSGLKPGSSFTVYRAEGGKAPTSIYSGTQTSFADNGVLKPNTIYTYTVASDQEGATELISVKTPLYNGWNIIAVPYNTTGIAPTSFFASPVSSIYEWLPTGATTESSTTQLGSYKTVTALAPGLGYFAKASSSSTLLTYSGAAGPASVTVTLKPGWTMIANPNVANKTNIGTTWLIDGSPLSDAINTNKIGGSIYWWNGTTYDSWTILGNNPQVEPWKGYWMINLESVNHTLTIQ